MESFLCTLSSWQSNKHLIYRCFSNNETTVAMMVYMYHFFLWLWYFASTGTLYLNFIRYLCLELLRIIIRIRRLNFDGNFEGLLRRWCILWPPLCPIMRTFSMSVVDWCQVAKRRVLLKLALLPLSYQLHIRCRSFVCGPCCLLSLDTSPIRLYDRGHCLAQPPNRASDLVLAVLLTISHTLLHLSLRNWSYWSCL